MENMNAVEAQSNVVDNVFSLEKLSKRSSYVFGRSKKRKLKGSSNKDLASSSKFVQNDEDGAVQHSHNRCKKNEDIIVQMKESKMIDLSQEQKYYAFGFNTVFDIDVKKCFPAPSNYVYRKLNKDWVRTLMNGFVLAPRENKILAVVMPIDPSTKTPLETLSLDDIDKVEYWIISGQHSISAAKSLQSVNAPMVTLQLRKQFRYRKAKIIVNCPSKVLREISKESNLLVEKSLQKESFVDQLLQARSQWKANGCPSKPPPGVNQSKREFVSWQNFVKTSEQTLQKGFIKNNLHILLGDDDEWKNWISIMRLYTQGALLNTKGEVQNTKEDPSKDVTGRTAKVVAMEGGKIKQTFGTVSLYQTLFRCIAGLNKSEILEIQKAILEKRILLRNTKSTKHMVDMEEMAWTLKTDRVLRNAIIAFFIDLTTEVLTWENLCEKYNITDVQYAKIRSYGETFVKDSLNRAKKSPPLPKASVTLLDHLYRVATGINTTINIIPWSIYGFGFDLNKLEGFCTGQVFSFNIAFFRFDSDSLHVQNECISSTFFSKLNFALSGMNSETEYILVSFIDFIHVHMLIEGVQQTATKMVFKIGAIQSINPSVKGELNFAIVLMYISREDNFQMIDKINPANLNILAQEGSNEFIDENFIDDFIMAFACEDSYVVELYCRGIVLQRSLSRKRRCFGICLDDLEKKQLESACSTLFENDSSFH